MKTTAAFVALLLLASGVATAQQVVVLEAEAPKQTIRPSTAGVVWAGPAIDLAAVRGKTVVMVSYVTWCPICNEWSPELFKQLQEAIKDKPVVILAINTNPSGTPSAEYMTTRGFLGPNILHGFAPEINPQFGISKPGLFNFAIVSPEGNVVRTGYAGGFYTSGGKKRSVLAEMLAKDPNLGKFDAITPDQSDTIKQALWPLELGRVTSDAGLKTIRGQVPAQERPAFDSAIDQYLENRVATVEASATGDLPERIKAFQMANDLMQNYRGRPQIEPVKKVLEEFNTDSTLKREAAAYQAYDAAHQQVNPARRTTLLRSVASRFKDTHYGTLAGTELTEASP